MNIMELLIRGPRALVGVSKERKKNAQAEITQRHENPIQDHR